MKSTVHRKIVWICGLALIAFALAGFLLRELQNARDRSEMEQLTRHMKTVCVGRFLIDLPVGARLTRRYESVSGMDIFSTDSETEEEFRQRMIATELEMSREMNRDGQPSLESSSDIALESGRGKVMVYDRRRTKVLEDDELVFSENVALRSMVRLADVSITGEIEWLAPRHIESVIGIFEQSGIARTIFYASGILDTARGPADHKQFVG